MSDFTSGVQDVLGRLDFRGVLDILIIAAIVFWILIQVRGTTAMALLRGLAIMYVAAWALSSLLDLQVLTYLLSNSITGLLIAVPIVFQPEIRRALERVGRLGMRALIARPALDQSIDSIVSAATKLSADRHGALIIMERETGLQDYIDTGVRLDASPTPELIEGIFFPNSPLHDGALIVRENRLVAAGCTLPLAEHAVKGSGTRHRAAMGISERTDAVSVVVSEETGNVSVAYNGRLLTRLSDDRLRAVLYALAQGDGNGVFGSTARVTRGGSFGGLMPLTAFGRGVRRWARRIALSVRSYWSLAILALALSIALWVAVTDSENPVLTDTFSSKIPIEAVNIPELLAISGGTSLGGATIRVTAREDAWEDLSAESFRAVADFAQARQGDVEVPVRVELVDDSLVDDVTIVDFAPGELSTRLDLRVEAVVPIRVNITGQPPVGFEAGSTATDPTEVTVSGPEALVQQVQFVEADVNLSGATVDLTQSFQVVPRSRTGVTIDGVTVEPDSVVVEVEIEQTVFSREVVVKPTVTGRTAEGYQVVGVSSDPPTVVVFGTQEALQTLSFVPTDGVDITAATDDVTQTVLLRLPPDLSAPEQPSVVVDIRVVPAQGEAVYGVVPEVLNLGQELDVTLNTPSIVVRLAGEIPALEALRPRDISVTVDAADLAPGVYRLTPEVELPAGVRFVDAGPDEVTLTISRRPVSPTPTPTPTATQTETPTQTATETETPEP